MAFLQGKGVYVTSIESVLLLVPTTGVKNLMVQYPWGKEQWGGGELHVQVPVVCCHWI